LEKKDEWMIGIGSHVSIEKETGLAMKAVQQTYDYAKLPSWPYTNDQR
jgi:prefoldin subunit 5